MYIGSSPNFGALDSQTITSANGSTATFTLNQYVPDSDSIIVTVGNVVQEPTEAYTASGNSITFTENVPNGDTIVVRYLGRSVDVYTGYKRVQRFKYVATNGQQTFTGADANSRTLEYTAQDIDVFYNGVRLDESEFTATNGSSVVLGTGATTNAELVILAYKVVQLADVVPASSGGTFTGNVVFSGNATVNGNLTASGTTTLVDTTNTVIKDNLLGLNHGATSNSNDAGIIVERGSTGNDALLIWDESEDKWALGTTTSNASSTGNLNMTTGTLVANLEGTIQTASQTNITSTGTLTSLNVSGNISFDGGSFVFNESGADKDFRVESTASTHKLFVDAGSDSVCIGGDIADYATSGANDLVVGNTNNEQNGITIVSGSGTGNSTLNFSDSNSGDGRQAGHFNYQHQYDEMQWYVNNLTKLIRFSSAGNLVPTSGFIKQINNTTSGGTFHNGTNIGGYNSGNYNEMGHNVNDWILLLKSYSGSGSNYGMYIGHTNNTSGTTSKFLQFVNTAGTKFEVFGNGNVQNTNNSYGQLSDERLKSDITDAKSQWDDLKSIKVRNFKKHNTGDLVQIGVVAQELEKISPHLIEECNPSSEDIKHDASLGTLYTETDKENGDIPDGRIVGDVKEVKEKVKAVKYSILYMKAVKALQEAMERIETLEAEVKELKNG